MTLELLRLEDLADRCGLRPSAVRRLVVLGVIDPVDEAPDLFPVEAALRVQAVIRLRRDLGVNPRGAAVILDLVERLDALAAWSGASMEEE